MKIAKIFKFASVAIALTVVASSCTTNDELYEKEMYEKVICLMSDGKLVFNVEHKLNPEGDKGFQSIAVGGSNPIDRDVTITLEHDDLLLPVFNKKEFDVSYTKYYKELPSKYYNIPSLTATLKKGSVDPYVTLPINVQTLGLSPDTVYVVSLRIKNYSAFRLDDTKKSVLYRIYTSNDYATQYPSKTLYSSLGVSTITKKEWQDVGGGVWEEVEFDESTGFTATKTAAPISQSEIRLMAAGTGDTPGGVDLEAEPLAGYDHVMRYGINVKIDANNKVSYSPYGNIQVQGVYDDDYYNTYVDQKLGDERRRSFYLKYKYCLNGSDQWITVTETLRRME